MRQIFVTTAVWLVLGVILSATTAYAPTLFPWVVALMLACLANNVRVLTNR